MKKNLLFVVCALLVCACSEGDKTSGDSDIYLVRHFQKEPVSPQVGTDVPLTLEGHENARRLADHLSNKRVEIIYSTNYTRTKQTATPTSELIGVPISSYNPKDLEAFAAQLLESRLNQLVVGHSNTTGIVFGFLGCESIMLEDSEYGDIFVVKRRHAQSDSTIVSCSRYQLADKTPDIANIKHVKQNDLREFYKQTNVAFTINNVLESQPRMGGMVEVGFLIDSNGNTSNFEIECSNSTWFL